MRKMRIDMTGLRFGRLVCLSFSHRSRSGHAQWLFACDCGAETIADGGNVRAGSTASCGCMHREICAARLTTHGHRAAKRHGPTYRAWQLMNDSCANPRSGGWKHCGGRGITVTPHWRSDFTAFLQNMGERPVGAILARLDTETHFTPANCQWVEGSSRAERAKNGARGRESPVRKRPPAPLPGQSGARMESVIQSSAGP